MNHTVEDEKLQQKFRKHFADECEKQKSALAEHLEKIWWSTHSPSSAPFPLLTHT